MYILIQDLHYVAVVSLLSSSSVISIRTESTARNDHCFIYALRASLSSYTGVHISCESALGFLADEVNNNFALYAQFSSSSTSFKSLKLQANCYFKLKSYNSYFCDILPLIPANTFCIRLYICSSIVFCSKIIVR